jgi:hypothetical protein
MSRTSYYYDPPGSLTLISAPGELCDECGHLGKIVKAGSLLPMPMNAIHEEYGGQEGNLHAHRECAERRLKELEKEIAAVRNILSNA